MVHCSNTNNLTENNLDETEEEILAFAIAQLDAETFNSQAKEIIVPFAIEYPENDMMVTVPKGGIKKNYWSYLKRT